MTRSLWRLRSSLQAAATLAALSILATPPLVTAQSPATPATLVITNANLIDGSGGAPQRNVQVVVTNGRITYIGSGAATISGAADTIDAAGRWVLPGLIDAHTHISTRSAMQRALTSGVTTVRSASTSHYEDVGLRELVRTGVIAGPDMLAAGVFVTPNLGETATADPRLAPLARGVLTPAQLREVVRINVDRGVDVIKTRATERAGLEEQDPRKQVYSESQLRAVVEEGAARGVKVFVHAHGDEGAYAAVKAGAHSIEHGTYLSDSTLALMKSRGTYFVPTYATIVDLTEPGGDYDSPLLMVRGRHMLPRLRESVRRAHALGIPIMTGGDTDYGPVGTIRIAHEVAYFVELGMSPMDAIRSATAVGAQGLGIADRTGMLTVGREGDIIVVERNPLEDITALQDVLVVISNGTVALRRIPFALPR
jgi:imidazolonepropionase-like amidohydrolase